MDRHTEDGPRGVTKALVWAALIAASWLLLLGIVAAIRYGLAALVAWLH